MSNFVSVGKAERIKSLILSGGSLRGIAATLGCHKHTVARYKSLLGDAVKAVTCVCGQRAGHRGWCSYRVARSPARQAFLARWTSTPLVIVRRAVEAKDKLPERIKAMVPRGVQHEIRDDLVNDLVVAVLSGEATLSEIPARIKKFVAGARKFLHNEYRDISIDAPISGTNGLTIGDMLAAPGDYEEAA